MVIRSLRWMRGVILKNRKSSEKLLVSLSIVSVGDMVRQERLRCSEHMERKDRSDCMGVSVSSYVSFGAKELGKG